MRAYPRLTETLLKNARKLYLPSSKIIPIRMHANSDTHAQRMRVFQEDAISFTSMGALLNVHSKLKGQCTDVKSGCVTSVGPSLTPHSLSLIQKSRATVPLKSTKIDDIYIFIYILSHPPIDK